MSLSLSACASETPSYRSNPGISAQATPPPPIISSDQSGVTPMATPTPTLSVSTDFDFSKTYVLLIGVLEWENPDVIGFPTAGRKDRVLEQTLLDAGVPRANMIFLADRAATKAGINAALSTLLQKTGRDSNFIFYYAGHGGNRPDFFVASYDFNPRDTSSTVTFAAIGDSIRAKFDGNLALFLGDMCYSGAFIRESQKQKSASLAITSATATILSTGNWTYTETLIQIFAGQREFDLDRNGGISLKEAGLAIQQRMAAVERQASGYGGNSLVNDSTVLRRSR